MTGIDHNPNYWATFDAAHKLMNGPAPYLSAATSDPVREVTLLVHTFICDSQGRGRPDSLAISDDLFCRFLEAYDAMLKQQNQIAVVSHKHPRPNRMVMGVCVYPETATLSVLLQSNNSPSVECYKDWPLFYSTLPKGGERLEPAKSKAEDKRIDEMQLADYRACIAAMARPYDF